MNMFDLEEKLKSILPDGGSIECDNNGQIIIYTGLKEDPSGDFSPEAPLIPFVPSDD